jgi:hypothetical protein
MTEKYTIEEVESLGREARFHSIGGERDGWIMPDGYGVDYAGHGQLVFEPRDICNIRYQQPEDETSAPKLGTFRTGGGASIETKNSPGDRVMATYSFITTIDAPSDEDAESARDEIGGSAEDARESGYLPEEVDMNVGDIVKKDLEEVLSAYRLFHDKLSVMIEDGKLHSFRDGQPSHYSDMVEAMAMIAVLDARDKTEGPGRE